MSRESARGGSTGNREPARRRLVDVLVNTCKCLVNEPGQGGLGGEGNEEVSREGSRPTRRGWPARRRATPSGWPACGRRWPPAGLVWPARIWSRSREERREPVNATYCGSARRPSGAPSSSAPLLVLS